MEELSKEVTTWTIMRRGNRYRLSLNLYFVLPIMTKRQCSFNLHSFLGKHFLFQQGVWLDVYRFSIINFQSLWFFPTGRAAWGVLCGSKVLPFQVTPNVLQIYKPTTWNQQYVWWKWAPELNEKDEMRMSRAALLTGVYPWRLGMQRGAIGAFRASITMQQTNKQQTNNWPGITGKHDTDNNCKLLKFSFC